MPDTAVAPVGDPQLTDCKQETESNVGYGLQAPSLKEQTKTRKSRTKKSRYLALKEEADGKSLDSEKTWYSLVVTGSGVADVRKKIEKEKLEGEFLIVCERLKVKSGSVFKIESV